MCFWPFLLFFVWKLSNCKSCWLDWLACDVGAWLLVSSQFWFDLISWTNEGGESIIYRDSKGCESRWWNGVGIVGSILSDVVQFILRNFKILFFSNFIFDLLGLFFHFFSFSLRPDSQAPVRLQISQQNTSYCIVIVLLKHFDKS